MNVLIDNIKYLREENNLSQKQLADLANISQGAISMIECGRREPNIITLKSIALALGVSIDYLVGMEEGQVPPIKTKKNSTVINTLSFKEEQIIVMYRKLSDGMKRNFFEMLSSISGSSYNESEKKYD